MKTLLLSPELFLAEGGIARVLRLYQQALCEAATPDDEVVSLVLNDPPGHAARLPRYASRTLRRYSGCGRNKFLFAIRTWRYSHGATRVLCGHFHQLPLVWLVRCLRPGLTYYLLAHGIEVWRPYRWLETRALRGAHRILCVSAYTRCQLLRFCPALDPARLVVVPNPLDPGLQPPAAEPPPAQTSGNGPRLLTVARLAATERDKGVDTLIEALPAILREYPQARLRVVGGGEDLPRLRAHCEQHQVAAAVDFVGMIPDQALRAEYAACDLFALPSRKEGFGLVFLEAMAHGKACLGARAGGAPEVIPEALGALVEYGNISEIAAAVIDLLRHPRDPTALRRQAAAFAFPRFQERVATALAE